MTYMASVPEWLGVAVLGAIIAALGYISKLCFEGVSAWRRSRAESLRQLLELASLLHASHEAFFHQRRLVGRLEESLKTNHQSIVLDRSGFERHFSQAFADFTSDETDLHTIIRGITQHTLHPVNQAISAWLQKDLTYRVVQGLGTVRGAGMHRGQLAAKLNQLDTHLLLWHAKYEAWIPEHPQHALVYLADEEHHGVGFPQGLDDTVTKVLQEMKAHLPQEWIAPNFLDR